MLKGGESGLGTYNGDDVLLYLVWLDLTVVFEEIASDWVNVSGCFVVPNVISMKRRDQGSSRKSTAGMMQSCNGQGKGHTKELLCCSSCPLAESEE